MTRQEAAAKARAARAQKRAQANGQITLTMTREQALGLYEVLETTDDRRAGAIRRRLMELALAGPKGR